MTLKRIKQLAFLANRKSLFDNSLIMIKNTNFKPQNSQFFLALVFKSLSKKTQSFFMTISNRSDDLTLRKDHTESNGN